MPSDRRIKCNRWILGIAIALATTGAYAAAVVAAAPEDSINVAANGYGDGAYGMSSTPRTYTPLEAGVRKAAMQGPEALRRYIWRTRMIYDYYYWDFVIRDQ